MTAVHTATLSGRLAEFATGVSDADVPEPVLAVARDHLLDALGSALASSGMDFGRSVHRAATRLGTGDESRALGFGTPLPAPSAALVNGTLMHGLDFDDTHIGAVYHATSPALATALAVGEAEHADGRAVLLAHVVGMEVGCRLAAAGRGLHPRGFHPTAIVAPFAAACVAARLRGLDPATLTSALGLCGSQAAGVLETSGSWLKRMHPGWAAHSGIIAATMAEAGFRGPATVFEGPKGLYATHLQCRPTATDMDLDSLGSRWWTAEIALKPYPCNHFIHAFVDAAFAVLDELGRDGLTAAEVDRIVCPTSPGMISTIAEPLDRKIAPPSVYDALFSLPFVVATALAQRRVDLGVFHDEPLDDPAVLALAAKVVCPPDPQSDHPARFPGEVEVHLVDGRVVRRRVPASHGTAEWPLTADEVTAKFLKNARRRVTDEQAGAIASAAREIDRLPEIGTLVGLCHAG